MKKKIIIGVCIILVIILLSIVIFYRESFRKKFANKEQTSNSVIEKWVVYDENGNIILKSDNEKEVDEIINNITVQGMVTLNNKGYVYTYNGQRFGEAGIEMEEYTNFTIECQKQECIDYYTSEKYDTSYIERGDIIICTGDLIKYKYGMKSDFDTKDNPIIVLKEKDYDNIKKEPISNGIATIEDYTEHEDYEIIYIRYNVSNKEYKFPFAMELIITEDTEVIGKIEKGRKIKVQYKNLNVPVKELELKSIEVINNDEINNIF